MRLFFTSVIVVLVSFFQTIAGQVKRTMRFSSRSGLFCSQTIILDSTGLFFNESGCEGRSKISFGRYKLSKDNAITFNFLSLDSIKPINKIVQCEDANEGDTTIRITFFDRYHKPLGVNFGIRLADTSNQVHEMWTDEMGQIEINHFLFKYVSLVQFLTIYKETDAIKIGRKSLKVYFNLPELFLMYPEVMLDQPRKLNLRLMQKGLYDTRSKAVVYKLD